jgi:glucose-6-phosphate 1-dehydrogenase
MTRAPLPALSDALVCFGASGDLAHKMIFPALFAMAKRGALRVPVIGVARSDWSLDQFRNRVKDSIERSGRGVDDRRALNHILTSLSYVAGDYKSRSTFTDLRAALGDARRPAHYLAIPPMLFEPVIRSLGAAGLAHGGRVIIEKPFGLDLSSAKRLNALAKSVFAERAIFRIDHFLGVEAIENLLYFRFANSFLEPIWNRNYISSIQITLAEAIGVGDRGAFYEATGCLRDVVQNHMLQIVALLAMEAPTVLDQDALRSAKLKVFQAMRALTPQDLVRGQFDGYRKVPGVAKRSDVETFCAVRLRIDSRRWRGVPWYLRSGKRLATTSTEVRVELKQPPLQVFAEASDLPANYIRFRLSPGPAIALAARIKRAGKKFAGDQREMYLLDDQPGEESAYERLLSDAMAGDGTLFNSEKGVEAAWAAVDPVLKNHQRAWPYKPGSWGPKQADNLLAAGDAWHKPKVGRQVGRTTSE